MSDKDLSWKFAEDFVVESPEIVQARQHSLEQGVEPISAAMGAQISLIAAASRAKTMIEIGTGLGVSGLWLMEGAPTASFTSIDNEPDYQQVAKAALIEAGVPANRVRLISGPASQVLPRMNESSYDLVFLDADPESLLDNVQHAIRLAKIGGTILVAHAMWHGRVADPTQREEPVPTLRALLATLAESSAVTAALSPVGDGLLQLVKKS